MLGYGALGEEKSGRRQLGALDAEGLEDSYLIQFVPNGGSGDDLFVESMAFLFSDDESAEQGLELIRKQNAAILPPANQLSSADLGEDAWGVSGDYGSAKQATATFGVLTANVVQTSTYARPRQGRERGRGGASGEATAGGGGGPGLAQRPLARRRVVDRRRLDPALDELGPGRI